MIIHELRDYDGYHLPKRRYSAFFDTDLDKRLSELSPETVTICGVCTDICVMYTAADARNRDYKVKVYADGVASFEFQYLGELISHTEFDTIYHEHFSYLSLTAAEAVLEAAGLTVFARLGQRPIFVWEMQFPFSVTAHDAVEVSGSGHGIVFVWVHSIRVARDDVPNVHPVDRVVRQAGARELCEGRQQVHRTERLLRRRPGWDGTWQAHDARTARSTVEVGALSLAIGCGTCVVSVGDPGTIVRGENDEGLVRDTGCVECLRDFAEGPVDFHHYVAIQSVT